LTGRPPFQAGSVLETLLQVKDQEPQPPRALDPGIPRDLETICLKCLEKTPHQRYGSALALAEDLERWLAGEPVLARRSGPWERGLEWARRHPALTALAAVCLAAVLVVLGVWAAFTAELQQAKDNAERSSAEEKRQRDLAESHLREVCLDADIFY